MGGLSELSYAGNILLASGGIGAFFVGRKRGAADIQGETNEAQRQTIDAQKVRIDLLTQQNASQQKMLDEMQIKLEYLEDLVLHGKAILVQEGSVPNVRRGGRPRTPTHPESN